MMLCAKEFKIKFNIKQRDFSFRAMSNGYDGNDDDDAGVEYTY